MIQDIGPEKFRNEYSRKRPPEKEDLVFLFRGRTVLLSEGDVTGDGVPDIIIPTVREVREAAAASGIRFVPGRADTGSAGTGRADTGSAGTGRTDMDGAGTNGTAEAFLQYLFTLGDTACFLWIGEDPAVQPPQIPGYAYEKLSLLRHSHPRDLSFAGETAYQLYCWYRDNRYCGRCGKRMTFGEKERNMICPVCGNVSYPRIMPAVIVGVTDGDRILMTRYRGREYRGHALIAGFCEIGETGEDTVRREVMEEAGLRVRNIRYYKSQPWGFDSDLLLGYYCEVDGGTDITMEEDELSVAEWVRREDITEKFENMSLTNEMICRFRDGTEGGRTS